MWKSQSWSQSLLCWLTHDNQMFLSQLSHEQMESRLNTILDWKVLDYITNSMKYIIFHIFKGRGWRTLWWVRNQTTIISKQILHNTITLRDCCLQQPTNTTDFPSCNPQLLSSWKLAWAAWLATGVVIHQQHARALAIWEPCATNSVPLALEV